MNLEDQIKKIIQKHSRFVTDKEALKMVKEILPLVKVINNATTSISDTKET